MDFVSRTMTQLRDLFASMTPAARITSALLLGVIVVSLGYLFQGHASGSKEYLFNGAVLQPEEAHRIEAALAKAKLSGWERQGDRILVPRGEKASYLAAVADFGALPSNFDTLLDDAQFSAFESNDIQRARLKALRERQISMMLREMEGIADAKVIYDIRQMKGTLKEQISATVSVQPDVGSSLEPSRFKLIRDAVVSSIAGLKPENVTILNLRDGSRFDSTSELSAAAFDDPYFQAKINYEQQMEVRILDLLRYIDGVKVKVTAELDPTLTAEIRSQKADDPAATRLVTQTESKRDSELDDRGQPGLTANGPGRSAAQTAVARNESTTESETSETQNLVPMTEELSTKAGLAPQHVRAAVAIPSEFIVRVWRERNPDKGPEDRPTATETSNIEKEHTDKISGLLRPLFPPEPAENIYKNVEVTFFQSLTPDRIEPPSTSMQALAWASQNTGSLMMGGLALVSLVMLRGVLKTIPPVETNVILSGPMTAAAMSAPGGHDGVMAGGPESVARESAAAGGKGGSDDDRPRLRLKKGPGIKEDLTSMVKEDPDAAAAILRSWIGNAG